VTTSGTLTKLVAFTNNGTTNKGRKPTCRLIDGGDGFFYGTTQEGGANGLGTVFKVNSSGSLTTLVEFSGTSGPKRGSIPVAGLVRGLDGLFYGTTSSGGTFDLGTVFRVSSTGEMETLFDFYTPTDGHPTASLILSADGNLYGTTSGPHGTIYRMVLPGSPWIISGPASEQTPTGAFIEGRINPRGSPTTVVLEYGLDDENFTGSVLLALNVGGFQTVRIGTYLDQLIGGGTYYYRFRSTSSAGTVYSEVRNFSTLSAPLTTATPATEIEPKGARFNGTVNPRNFETNVRFEWGTDGNTFPNSLPLSGEALDGGTSLTVSSLVSGLTKGTTYHYRVVAENSGGTTVSGTQTFRTPTEPLAAVGGRFFLNTTSVRLHGTVDPLGSETDVTFEYGTEVGQDGAILSPSSVSATPATVSGFGPVEVSAVISNLQQGTTYYYGIRAASAGGTTHSTVGSFSMGALSGLDRDMPGAIPEAQGFLVINLLTNGGVSGWRFVGEREWRRSGIAVAGLTTGDRQVEFRPLPGRIQPPSEMVSIVSGEPPTILDRTYFDTGGTSSGGIRVTLKPDSVASGENGARWRLLGEDESAWRHSGETREGLRPGSYLIECEPVPGRITPPNGNVTVTSGQVSLPRFTYYLASSGNGAVPVVQSFEAVKGDGGKPFAFVGQIRGNGGSGTGFVVRSRVVATAAHVVWNEATLSATENLQWLHQRHRETYEPVPVSPRGFYLLTDYADQRETEASPGSFSPQSRNLDVAAMYFNVDAARGGFGGFLASDLDENEFLLSDEEKMLVGYPIDDFAAESRGRLHATDPFNVEFTAVGASANRVFYTTDIRSSGGGSGGPLCVQFEGGAYYPAAIYLGGVEQTFVRAIDSSVILLFDKAAESGLDDQPHVGGGVSFTEVQSIGGPGDPGSFEVVIQPAGARSAGAKWRLRPETAWRTSGSQLGGLNAGGYVLELFPAPGFQNPTPQNVFIAGGQLKTLTFTYALPPVLGPEISVRGRGRGLPNGDASPSALDGTDFGVVALENGTGTRTFTVFNTGNRALSLGTPAFSGDHAADFEVTTPPAPSVPPGGSTSFTVSFDPSASGVRTATLSLPNNDANENPFNFALQGNHVADANSNGFSDVEEAALNALLATFTVGQRVDLDLSFLRLADGQVLAVTGLPPGLVFNPTTNRLTGTILAKPAPGHLLRKMDGATELGSRAFDLRVFFPARLVVSTAPRRFAPTLVNRRSAAQFVRLTNSGELPLQRLAVRLGGTAPNDFLLPVRPPATLNPGASATVSVVFRPLRKGTRLGSLILTSSDAPRSVPLSGFGQ